MLHQNGEVARGAVLEFQEMEGRTNNREREAKEFFDELRVYSPQGRAATGN